MKWFAFSANEDLVLILTVNMLSYLGLRRRFSQLGPSYYVLIKIFFNRLFQLNESFTSSGFERFKNFFIEWWYKMAIWRLDSSVLLCHSLWKLSDGAIAVLLEVNWWGYCSTIYLTLCYSTCFRWCCLAKVPSAKHQWCYDMSKTNSIHSTYLLCRYWIALLSVRQFCCFFNWKYALAGSSSGTKFVSWCLQSLLLFTISKLVRFKWICFS